jgi:hypothetical protein
MASIMAKYASTPPACSKAACGSTGFAVTVADAAFAAIIASWVGALLNTSRLDDKTWFVVLLVLGLVSAGWVAMIAYVLAGPDGTAQDSTPSARAGLAGN